MAQTEPDTFKSLVPDLDQGASYLVRVMARNAFGSSEPLQTTEPVVLERPPTLLTPPGPCTPPLKVVSITADTVTLRWQVPEDDGGSPVTGYVISQRDLQSRQWEELETLPG